MPRIIAKSIADLVARAGTEAEVRKAIVVGISAAESAGYSPGSENLFGEICDQLKDRADAEHDEPVRERLRRAAEIVCEIADELGANNDDGKAAPL